jgi:hypothetical protein
MRWYCDWNEELMTEIGTASSRIPVTEVIAASSFPAHVYGTEGSPYPTVVIVTKHHHILSGMEENGERVPSSRTYLETVGSARGRRKGGKEGRGGGGGGSMETIEAVGGGGGVKRVRMGIEERRLINIRATREEKARC